MSEPTREQTGRYAFAWLIWCHIEGYTHPDDRATLTNWLLDDPDTLSPDDRAEAAHLLHMADEILTDEELEPIHLAWLRERLGVDLDELRKAMRLEVWRDGTTEEFLAALRTTAQAARALLDLLGEDATHDE